MSNFSELFFESKGQPINYNGKTLILSDKFPVKNGDTLVISIEKTNSDFRQGLCVDITGYCECDGEIFKQGKGIRMLFWEDTAPKQIKLRVFTDKDFVRVENIWERINSYLVNGANGEVIEKTSKSITSRINGAAMIVEEIENGRRYRCNDGVPDDDFDDIIFTVQRLKQ